VLEIRSAAEQIIKEIRKNSPPQALVINTRRFGPHSKGDDTRDEEEIQSIRNIRDPISHQAKRLDNDQIELIEQEVNDEVLSAFQTAVSDPNPEHSR
jgi:2-oxoisovalerate dehydrogenase E1 component